jgi:energy-coupling factor transporter ATP-binding protein EcfA2
VDLGARAGTAIGHLSGGQKKRASLANEIVSQPNLLFLDEVTSRLDEGADWEMMKLFRRLADGGMTIVCVTHTVANVEDFCHKIVILVNPGSSRFMARPRKHAAISASTNWGTSIACWRRGATRSGAISTSGARSVAASSIRT